MRELALFAGAGGGILGGCLLGWRTVCAVESNPYTRSVLLARQNDGTIPPFPIWDDIKTFEGKPWKGIVDVVSGGFPCQDISSAGKGDGIQGERSRLWFEMARIIDEVRPQYVWVENVTMLLKRGIDVVIANLAEMGYDAKWGIVGAYHAGARHQRERIWIIGQKGVPHANGRRDTLPNKRSKKTIHQRRQRVFSWWETEPGMDRVVDGVAYRMDRNRALGNGQVPQSMALAWKILVGELNC